MTEVRDFIAALARAGKRQQEIKILVDAAYGDKSLSISQINRIIKAVNDGKSTSDQSNSNSKKTRTAQVVADSVEEDWRVTVCTLAARHGLTCGTVSLVLNKI